jgi:flagellar L-ring protein precursor FlgH
MIKGFRVWVVSLCYAMLCASTCFGQNGSLFHAPIRTAAASMVNYQTPNPNSQVGNGSVQNAEGLPLGGTIGNGSPEILPNGGLQGAWTYIPPTQARQIHLRDIVTIRVDESATSLLLGNATSRKTTSYDAVVRDWIRMVGLDTIKPAPQSDGDPRVQVNQNEVFRGDSTIRTSESLTFNIAAQVVDILPNGLIVLEGTTTLELNDNRLEVSLIGTCRTVDIEPNNTVLSRNLVNKHIKKRENGHVRDGYSRGWLTRFLALVKPF